MSCNFLRVLRRRKRKTGKNVDSEETTEGPIVRPTLDINVVAATPRVTEPTSKTTPNFLGGSSVQPNPFSFIGAEFDDNEAPPVTAPIIDNAKSSGSSSSGGRSKSMRRTSGETETERNKSIDLSPKGEHETTSLYERQLPFLTPGLDVPSALQQSTQTEGGLTTCGDGGHGFEANYLRNNTELVVARDYSNHSSVIESVRDDLNARESKLESAASPNAWFIPCTNLHQIMTFETVYQLLGKCDPGLPESSIREKAARITPPFESSLSPFRRVFAILILIRKESAIFRFLDNGIDDFQLPLYFDNEERPESDIFQIADFKDQDIRDFCRTQWEVWPVFFSSQNGKIVHYECRRGEILPFMKHKWKLNKKGGSGELACYALHPHQQDFTRHTKDGPNRAIAVKKLFKPNSRAEFNKEHLMLDRLTQYLPENQHLAKLLATYEMPKSSDKSESKDYFLVFECADSTLKELWTKDPEGLMAHQEVAKWVASQSQGLAAALSSIHNFNRAVDDPNDRTHGFHGDLKPDNVLLYNGWVRQNHELGVLQITDFGLSSFHHTWTADAIKIKHLTGDYRPPESELVLPISASLDTWTLGCLSLDFLTWLVRGPNGQRAFEKARESKGIIYDMHTCFWEAIEEDDVTTVGLSEAVIKWVADLCRDSRSSQFVRDFCGLIIHQMLIIEDKGLGRHDSYGTKSAGKNTRTLPTERIKTLKLASDMQTMFIGKDSSYYTPSKAKEPLDLSGPRHCVTMLKPKRQLRKEGVERLNKREPS